MARPKAITTDELVNHLNEYRIANPHTKVTIPNLGAFIRSLGVDVQDYTIRRNTEFRAVLDEVNKKLDDDIYSDTFTYNALDAKAFIRRNNTPEKLISALTNRDTYYCHIADKASKLVKLNQSLQREISDKDIAIKDLAAKLDEAKYNATLIKEKDKAIKALKDIIDIYVYPSAANALLAKEGILEIVAGVVDDDTIDQLTISANTDIETFTSGQTKPCIESADAPADFSLDFPGKLPSQFPADDNDDDKPFKYDSVNNLLGGFD